MSLRFLIEICDIAKARRKGVLLMQAVGICEQFDPSIFNSLNMVEEANQQVQFEGRLQHYLDAVKPLFFKHGVQKRFGIGLLHRHDSCNDGEHMIESEEEFAGEKALVTRPCLQTPGQTRATPVVWALKGGALCPLEYSTDMLAGDLYRAGDIPSEFLSEFASFTSSSPIGKWMGLAVVKRKFYQQAKLNEGAVELSSEEERCNVVYLRDRAQYKTSAIETAWSFSSETDIGKGCDRSCFIDSGGNHRLHHRPS
jgi:hypothetical protein